jgi:hypothetical protein
MRVEVRSDLAPSEGKQSVGSRSIGRYGLFGIEEARPLPFGADHLASYLEGGLEQIGVGNRLSGSAGKIGRVGCYVEDIDLSHRSR